MTGAVLVTGATGFIGREVTRRLVARGRPVIALARARAGVGADQRVARALTAGGVGQVEVIEGDLALPGCGLGNETVRRLRERVGTVLHCAGDTSFFPDSPEEFLAGHVDGPCELLERLHGGRLSRWGHLSTAYVCGRRTGTILESEGHVGQTFRNFYERVKLESETAIRAAGSRFSVDVRVFRPSVVVGEAPETTGGGPSLLLFGLIRMAAALARQASTGDLAVRVPLAPEARFNLVPLGYVADAIARLAEHPDAAGQTFHLVVRDPPSNREILGHITGRLGLAGVILTDPRSQPLDAPSLLERKIARLLAGYREYLEQHLCFDDRNARRVLDVAGLGCPLLSAEVFNRLMEQALGHGWPADAGRAGKHPRDGGRNREPHRRRCVA